MDSWSVLAKVVPAQRQIQTSNHPRNYFCSALDIASLGGRPCLHCLTLQFVESNILYLPTRVVQHPRRLRLDFPLDKICPVTNPKEKKLIGLKKTEICHLQGKYNWHEKQPQSTRLSHFRTKGCSPSMFWVWKTMGGPVCPVQRPPWPRGSTWLPKICQDLAEVNVTMCPAETFRGPGTFLASSFLFYLNWLPRQSLWVSFGMVDESLQTNIGFELHNGADMCWQMLRGTV